MKFVSPTGKGIRNDKAGLGCHGAPRGNRLHNGVDCKGVEGQGVVAPHDGVIVSESFPYSNDLKWRGVKLVHPRITSKLWYISPFPMSIGKEVKAGESIGILQNIGEKYNGATPHVHWRIDNIDPMLLNPLLFGEEEEVEI